MRDLTVTTAASMTSREIADLVGSRHDSVRRTVERLAERGTIALPPLVEKSTAGRPATHYVFTGEKGKRDSYVVVAQLSPEFTAKLVDRWQELEAKNAAPDLSTDVGKTGTRWRTASYARDRYLTEHQSEITPHGQEPFIKYTPVLLRKGAVRLHELYLAGELPMKKSWNGQFTHDKESLGVAV